MIDVLQIGLATDKSKIPLLCVMEPFLAGNGVLITPWVNLSSEPHDRTKGSVRVVVLVLDNTLRVRRMLYSEQTVPVYACFSPSLMLPK